VVCLSGASPKGRVNQELVEMLRDLMERAEQGQIAALAYAATDGDDLLQSGWESGGHNLLLSSSIAVLNTRYQNVLLEDH
jgi:hypothetical protein